MITLSQSKSIVRYEPEQHPASLRRPGTPGPVQENKQFKAIGYGSPEGYLAPALSASRSHLPGTPGRRFMECIAFSLAGLLPACRWCDRLDLLRVLGPGSVTRARKVARPDAAASIRSSQSSS